MTTLAALPNGYGTNAEYGATNIGHVFLPQTPESYGLRHRWQPAFRRALELWLGRGEPADQHDRPERRRRSGPCSKLDFTYDYMGRRIQKIVSTNNGSGWVYSYTNRFVYDGWNVVAILDGGNNLLYSFTWGLDLSGSLQGAGGVGGLVSMRVYGGANAGTYFYCYDGNGNVAALVNAGNGSTAAQYEYGPFGEVIRATGPMAKVNPFMFSTKFYDWETGLYYYGYRYYNPSTGRFLNRDPKNENGFITMQSFITNEPQTEMEGDEEFGRQEDASPTYVFVQNNAINQINWLGLLVLLEAHPVAAGFNHSKVTLMVNCDSKYWKDPRFNHIAGHGGLEFATIGAGPEGPTVNPPSKLGHLISGINRPRDINRDNNISSYRIPAPNGWSEDDFIEHLLRANSYYNNQAWYALFPNEGDPNHNNSNGYASGILRLVTHVMPPQPPNTPGFQHFVPRRYFRHNLGW